MSAQFGIWCEVFGGVTGHRQSWLKHCGELARFASRAQAEQEAARLNAATNGNPHRTASFSYIVRPLPAPPREPDPDRRHDAKRNGD
jgi:hypothetical protein